MRFNTILVIALFAACALIVVLGYQNRQLLAEQGEAYTSGLQPKLGDWLPRVDGHDLNGADVAVGNAKRAQVIYFFSPSCHFCAASAPAIRSLQDSLKSGDMQGIDIIGVGAGTKEQLSSYALQNEFSFPIILGSKKIIQLFSVRQVPLLVAVDSDGRVLYSHFGVIKNKDDVANLLTALRAMDGRSKVLM